MTLSIRQIRYFIATAELGQVSRAAVELSISQSAITTAIRELEQVVGLQLFSRSPAGMDLTPAGRQFLFHAYEILHKIEDALAITVPSGVVHGRLVVAATYTVIGYFLPRHFERMRRAFPNLEIQLVELPREAIEIELLTGKIDIAVLLTSNVNNPLLRCETLVSSPRRLWVPWRHPLLGTESVGLEEVAREPYIMLTVDEASATAMKYWSSTPFEPDIELRTSSVEGVRSMVASAHGVAILSDMVYRPWSLEGQRLETIVLRDPIPAMDVGMAWRRDGESSLALDAFRSYFRQAYQISQASVGVRDAVDG